MATCVNNLKVGQHVYRHGLPLNAGTIVEVYPYGAVKVLWSNGDALSEWTLGLRDFDALIADHEKKLSTHRATLAKLEQMCPK